MSFWFWLLALPAAVILLAIVLPKATRHQDDPAADRSWRFGGRLVALYGRTLKVVTAKETLRLPIESIGAINYRDMHGSLNANLDIHAGGALVASFEFWKSPETEKAAADLQQTILALQKTT